MYFQQFKGYLGHKIHWTLQILFTTQSCLHGSDQTDTTDMMIKAHNKRESNTETWFNGLFYRCRFRSRGGGRTKANMYSTIFMKNHFEGYKIPPRYVTRVRSESILTLKCSQINSSHTGILINFSADKKHRVHGTHDCVTTLFAFSWFLLKP